MTPEEPTTTPTAPSRHTLIVSLIGLVAIAGIAVAAFEYWPARLPPLDAPATDLVKFCATDQFASLPRDKQQIYVDTLMSQGFQAIAMAAVAAHMTPDQMQRGRQNAMIAGMEYRWGRHLDNWLKLDAKGKADYVKQVVATMPPRPPGFDPRGGRNGRPAMSPQQQKNFIESMAPDRRAAMAEFMTQIRAAHGDGGK